jgi:hypothetical protein
MQGNFRDNNSKYAMTASFHNFSNTFLTNNDQVQEGEMGLACSKNKCTSVFVGNPERKRPL